MIQLQEIECNCSCNHSIKSIKEKSKKLEANPEIKQEKNGMDSHNSICKSSEENKEKKNSHHKSKREDSRNESSSFSQSKEGKALQFMNLSEIKCIEEKGQKSFNSSNISEKSKK